MPGKMRFFMVWGGVFMLTLLLPELARAKPFLVNARSAILIDVSSGEVLFEQNGDAPIAPASITKILTLYLVFDAIEAGRVHPSDLVRVSSLAAHTGGSRMGLRTGDEVPLHELIKGMAVVSGNDACVAVAEYLEGSVENFVRKMNAKARELGMHHSLFLTPNGLPAKGQLTTARDIAKLSIAYLHRFPESLSIHSLCSYTYRRATHHNANRLLGKCPGVDGIKTGFVCASGYNISATAIRGDTRILAVVMGAPRPGVRARETARLLEGGFHMLALAHPEKARQLEALDLAPGFEREERVASAKKSHGTRLGRRRAGSKARSSGLKSKIARKAKGLKYAGTSANGSSTRRKTTPQLTKKHGRAESMKHARVRKHSNKRTEISTASTSGIAKKGKGEKASSTKRKVALKGSHKQKHRSRGAKEANNAREYVKGKNHKKRKHTSNLSSSRSANRRAQPHASDARQNNG